MSIHCIHCYGGISKEWVVMQDILGVKINPNETPVAIEEGVDCFNGEVYGTECMAGAVKPVN